MDYHLSVSTPTPKALSAGTSPSAGPSIGNPIKRITTWVKRILLRIERAHYRRVTQSLCTQIDNDIKAITYAESRCATCTALLESL